MAQVGIGSTRYVSWVKPKYGPLNGPKNREIVRLIHGCPYNVQWSVFSTTTLTEAIFSKENNILICIKCDMISLKYFFSFFKHM